MFGREPHKAGNTDGARADDLAELLDRCADFAERADGGALSAQLSDNARRLRGGDWGAIDAIDALFAWDGPLHLAAIGDGWDEEYVGLAAAYRVESAPFR